MNVDLTEYRASLGKRAESRASDRRPQLEMLAQAAVKAEMLTGDAAWDQYLSFLRAAREKLKTSADAAVAKLRNPALVDTAHVAQLRAAIAQADAQVAILDAVMALPADIKKSGAEAKDLLSRLAGNSEETEPTA